MYLVLYNRNKITTTIVEEPTTPVGSDSEESDSAESNSQDFDLFLRILEVEKIPINTPERGEGLENVVSHPEAEVLQYLSQSQFPSDFVYLIQSFVHGEFLKVLVTPNMRLNSLTAQHFMETAEHLRHHDPAKAQRNLDTVHESLAECFAKLYKKERAFHHIGKLVKSDSREIAPGPNSRETQFKDPYSYLKDNGLWPTASSVQGIGIDEMTKEILKWIPWPEDYKGNNYGFALYHPYLQDTKVLVNHLSGKVEAVIDWVNARTVPKFVCAGRFPQWLADSNHNYDGIWYGWPGDEDRIQREYTGLARDKMLKRLRLQKVYSRAMAASTFPDNGETSSEKEWRGRVRQMSLWNMVWTAAHTEEGRKALCKKMIRQIKPAELYPEKHSIVSEQQITGYLQDLGRQRPMNMKGWNQVSEAIKEFMVGVHPHSEDALAELPGFP